MSWAIKRVTGDFDIRWSSEFADKWIQDKYWRMETCVDFARRRTEEDPDKSLLLEPDRRLTRRDCYASATRLARFFVDRGLKPGDVIAFQLPNWIETGIISLAAKMTGLVIAPLQPIYREAELRYMLADCKAKLLFIPHIFKKFDHRELLVRLRSSLPLLRDVIVVRGLAGGELSWEEALDSPALDPLPQIDPTAVFLVMYTSGTTGRAKGVLHTHANFLYRARAMSAAWKICESDIVFMPSPVTHITGAFWSFDMPWVDGFTSVLLDVWNKDSGINTIADYSCTISGGATPFLQQLIDAADGRVNPISSLRMFFCGGTTVAPSLIRKAREIFPHCMFFRTYGSTEMPTTTLGIRDQALGELGATTDGEVVPPTEVRIVDAVSNEPLPRGVEGEIAVRGPEQFVGYLHPEDNVDAFDAEGFFRMGDLGRLTDNNYLTITGRKKDIVIRSGENISPKEVEDVLLSHPAVTDIAIVAMPSVATGEIGCAFMIVREGMSISLPEIQHYLTAAGLARQKFPERLVIVDELPRVPSGKIRKDVLRQTARALAEQI